MSTPFFVGIGAQRSGTSWLSLYLQAHPQVGFSPLKEMHFFDVIGCDGAGDHFNRRMRDKLQHFVADLSANPSPQKIARIRCLAMRLEMISDPRRYKDFFDYLAEPEHRVLGEITPAYATLDREGFARIQGYYPDVKFVFLLRDPVDRFISQVRYTNKDVDVEKVVAPESMLSFLDNEKYALRSDYKHTLTELGAVADKDNICVAFFEHLMDPASHRTELERITDFLVVDCEGSNVEKKVNPGREADVDPKVDPKLAAAFAETYEYITAEFGDRVPARWRERMALV